ncbi:50S ribosomal protein L33 [Lactobacillus sp. DCY120]|uniref:Large ribosomal subunit protein bL33 n=1 Tax=Bombilactobacillus apium TaxID=2675299 RepID=A0A850R557_9LACO|nr:50S ribosomal protein L33 [Bombilactobacillus apium]NVY95987.1 50S ribosomal protein L33 [Bombilactobacillus apium]
MKTETVVLECSQCGAHNYHTLVNRARQERFMIKKYCPQCDQHTLHQETR